ncbi:MAG: hypothetical protein ACFFG0_04425 [Candidatus Thorarchaeota archaeon]
MPIVIQRQQQPSPLSYLLGGIGQGLLENMLYQQQQRRSQLQAQQIGSSLQGMMPGTSPLEQLTALLQSGVPLQQSLPIAAFAQQQQQQQANISPSLGQFIQQGLPQNVSPREAFASFLGAGLKPSEAATTAKAVTAGRQQRFEFEAKDLNRRFKERAELIAKPFIQEGFNTNFFNITKPGAKEGLKQLNKLLKSKANAEIKLRKKYGLDIPEDLKTTVRLETQGQGLNETAVQVLDKLNELGVSNKPLITSEPRKLNPNDPNDIKIAIDILKEAKGNKQKAKEMARQRGYIID